MSAETGTGKVDVGIRRRACAFSLIELVIAMAILAVGLVGAMRVFPVGLRASQRAKMSSQAGMTAQRVIESLKLTSCLDLADHEETVDEFAVSTRVTAPLLEHITEPGRLKVVEVDVAWTQDGKPRTLGVVTYVRCDTTGHG